MTLIFHWFFMWKMDTMSGFDIRLVFTLPPRDSTLQNTRYVHFWINFPCITFLRHSKHTIKSFIRHIAIYYICLLYSVSRWRSGFSKMGELSDLFPDIPDSVVCVLHSVFCVLYSVVCVLHSVLCVLYSVFCFLYFKFSVLYSMFCILYSLFCILYSVFYILNSVFCILCSLFILLYSVSCILYSVFFIVYFVLCIPYIFYISILVFCTYSVFCVQNPTIFNILFE